MLKIIGFVNKRGGKAIIPTFDQPPVEWKSVKQLFDQVMNNILQKVYIPIFLS